MSTAGLASRSPRSAVSGASQLALAAGGDNASAAIVELIERLTPSIVQLRVRGRGVGAGVVWTSDGGIVTNAHVVADAPHVDVVLYDGRQLPGRVLRSSRELDLALLHVAAGGLTPAAVGDSSGLRVGELVFAIGHPWGQRGVATAGIVSSTGHQHIQSDVLLAPGNSGGPLLNAAGQVVGINSMIFGGDLAVAIPSHVVQAWLARPAG